MKHISNIENLIGSLTGRKILDVGSGRGKFLFACKKRNLEVVGLELDQNKISQTFSLSQELTLPVEVIEGKAEEMPFGEEAFGFLNISEVIEHVNDPRLALKEAHRVLRPEGYAYVSVPNRFGFYDSHFHLYGINWLPRRWAEKVFSLLGLHKDYQNKVDHQRLSEMHYFTFGGFKKLAQECGFSLIDIREARIAKMFPKSLGWLALAVYRFVRHIAFDSFHFLLKKDSSLKTRIVFLANYRLPTEKAHGFQISKMCEEFGRAGALVELWFPRRKNSVAEDIFEFYSLKKNFKTRIFFLPDFISLKKKIGLGSLLFFLQSVFFFFRLIMSRVPKGTLIISRQPEIVKLFKLKGYQTVFDAHFWPTSKGKIFSWLVSTVDFVICNSEGTAAEFKKRGFKKVLTAPNGVDLDEFDKVSDSKNELRSKLNLPLDKSLITYVGHLYKWKGVETILQTAELSKDQGWLFVLVGGTQKDLNKYKAWVEGKNLTNVLLVGPVKKEIIPFYLKSADCLLLPNEPVSRESELYTSPIKMFEYMASGVPVIASSLPSLREILNDQNAFWFKAGDSLDLREKIRVVFLNGDEAKIRSLKAKEEVRNYTWEKRAKRILEFLRD